MEEFKKLLYLQVPLSTALWGARSWTLTEQKETPMVPCRNSSQDYYEQHHDVQGGGEANHKSKAL